jgi:hypothetical protein
MLIKTLIPVSLEVDVLLGDLIGEFKGKNSAYRVLSDGKTEVSGQGTGKILGVEATMVFTAVSTVMPNGVFRGEGNGQIWTRDGDIIMVKMTSISWSSEKGGITRSASFQTTQSQKLSRLNKVIGLHETETEMNDNWTTKIWEWK